MISTLDKTPSKFAPTVSSRILHRLVVLGLAIALSSCGSGGGGGGGDSFVGAAVVNVRNSPSKIDVGDRTQVKIQISSVHQDGIALKVRFPFGLVYVPSSSFMDINGDEKDMSPTVYREDDSVRYLVYYFTKKQFSDSDAGELVLELEGIEKVEKGKIEVDADVDDPLISNDVEFSLDNPEFGAEDEASITVTE